MKKEYTHISIVLDKSGSMLSCLNDTVGGFNSFLKAQKEVDGEATITLVQFNESYDIAIDMKPLSESSDLNNQSYRPHGNTALLDAIGKTINDVESKINDMDEDQQPEKVIFVIITDGEENASREFKHENVMEMINRHKEENKWEFVFIGANQDSIQTGSLIGVRAGSTLNYIQTPAGTKDMYASLTRGMANYRSKSVIDSADVDFFDAETD
jgi:uncharacterized protein YegL